jgi:oligosaccharide repeat unit polymerase
MTESWLLSLIIGLFLTVLALFARIQLRSWLAPGAFFALMWSAFLLLPLIIAPGYEVSTAAVLWIFASVLAVYVGNLVSVGDLLTSLNRRRAVPSAHLYLPLIKCILAVCILLGLGYTLVRMWLSGYSMIAFLSLDTLAKMGHEFSVARYSGGDIPPFLAQFLLVFVYTGPLFGGLLFISKSSKSSRLLALLSLVPAIFAVVVFTTRAVILFAGTTWIASYFAGRVLLERNAVRLFTKRNLLGVFLLAPLLIALSLVMYDLFRTGTTALSPVDMLNGLLRVRAHFFGYLSAFSRGFQNIWYEDSTPGFGAFSMKGIFWRLGLRELPGPGQLLELGPEGQLTNITTLFSQLITDFTLPGSLLVLFAVGTLAGWAYYRVMQGEKLYLPILATFYSLTICSFTTSIFNYNSIIVSLFVFAVYFLFLKFTYSGSRGNMARTGRA